MQSYTEQELIVTNILMESVGTLYFASQYSYFVHIVSGGVYGHFGSNGFPFSVRLQCHSSGYTVVVFYENFDGSYEIQEMGFDFHTPLDRMSYWIWDFIIRCVKEE